MRSRWFPRKDTRGLHQRRLPSFPFHIDRGRLARESQNGLVGCWTWRKDVPVRMERISIKSHQVHSGRRTRHSFYSLRLPHLISHSLFFEARLLCSRVSFLSKPMLVQNDSVQDIQFYLTQIKFYYACEFKEFRKIHKTPKSFWNFILFHYLYTKEQLKHKFYGRHS